MNRTVSTGSLVLAGESRRDRPSASAGPPPPAYPPIYAALLGEWQAAGRTVPGPPDVQGDTPVTTVRAPLELPAPTARAPLELPAPTARAPLELAAPTVRAQFEPSAPTAR